MLIIWLVYVNNYFYYLTRKIQVKFTFQEKFLSKHWFKFKMLKYGQLPFWPLIGVLMSTTMIKYQILRCLRSASNYSNLVWFCFRWLALPSWAIICEFTTWCLKSCLLSLPWDLPPFSNLWHFDPKSGPLSKHIYMYWPVNFIV